MKADLPWLLFQILRGWIAVGAVAFYCSQVLDLAWPVTIGAILFASMLWVRIENWFVIRRASRTRSRSQQEPTHAQPGNHQR